MAFRAYVARSGWRETPITPAEWRAAASSLPELEVHASYHDEAVCAVLRGSQRRRLSWNDGYISAHHTNERLVAVLFVLAERLGAHVYSEHRRPYLDLADWQERQQRQQRRKRPYEPRARSYGHHHVARARTSSADWLPFAFMVALAAFALWALDFGAA